MRLLRAPSILLFLAACSGPTPVTDPATEPPTETDALADARAVWETAGIESYAYDVLYGCFCPQSRAHVVVMDGVVAEVTQSGEVDTPPSVSRGIDELFDVLRDATDDGVDSIEVTYDPRYGFPALVSADPIEDAVDDEWSWTISDFEIL